MPAKWFICPEEERVEIAACLEKCPKGTRCMLLPTIRAVAGSLNREIVGMSVTELLVGTRETYLKKMVDYAVDPKKRLSALLGTGLHAVHEGHAYGDISSEVRLYGEHCSGKYDLYGAVLDDDNSVLADVKSGSAFKVSRSLGFYKADVATGEVYKSGPRKGQPKTNKEWRTDGVRHILDWAVQINAYRILLEAEGLPVSTMVIQAIVRDSSARAESEQNLDRAAYLIPINKISDCWVQRYLGYKAVLLEMALKHGVTPPPCNHRERWGGRKCLDYCEVADYCEYGQKVKRHSEEGEHDTESSGGISEGVPGREN